MPDRTHANKSLDFAPSNTPPGITVAGGSTAAPSPTCFGEGRELQVEVRTVQHLANLEALQRCLLLLADEQPALCGGWSRRGVGGR